MLLNDINEIKRVLEIDPRDTSEDVKLNFFITEASKWIEVDILNRPGFSLAERTEYYTGTGTSTILLNSRPVYTTPTPQVWIDEYGDFGQASGSFGSGTALTYGVDCWLRIDGQDSKSRSGILYRRSGFWPNKYVRQVGYLTPYIVPNPGNIKITYTAGYTVDDLPAVFRLAMNLLVARMRNLFPLGMWLGSESYEERGLSYLHDRKSDLLREVRHMIAPYRNWAWTGRG